MSNRIKEITILFPATSWHFCPTTENPADLLTREISSQQFISSILWKSGPQWLASPQQWPVWPATDIQAATIAFEADTSVSESTTIQTTRLCQLVNINKYSNLTKLFSVTVSYSDLLSTAGTLSDCAVSKAVHLEIVTDLTVETFLQAFRRFSSRKSLPRLLISDNAPTYMSAAEELQLLNSSHSLRTFTERMSLWR